jgi:hypothetical protein
MLEGLMNAKKLNELWTPVARGKIYCSPACGAGCTRGEHDRAKREALRLVNNLRGRGWKPIVWEGLGWHFKAVSGPLEIHGEPGSFYSCSLGKSGRRVDGDPNRLVMAVLESERLRLAAEIGELREACEVSGRFLNLPPTVTIWAHNRRGAPEMSLVDRELLALVKGTKKPRKGGRRV